MSILGDDPIVESDVMEQVLIQDNVWNYSAHTRPYIGFFAGTTIQTVSSHLNDIYFRPDMIRLSGDTLHFDEKRSGVLGPISWERYGIKHLETDNVLILEGLYNNLPQSVKAKLLYLADNYGEIKNRSFYCQQIKFSKYWVGEHAGLYNVRVDCMTMNFNDCPRVFHNLTGKCDNIILHCMEFTDVPGLNESVIPQTINGKRIKTVKDIRAYYNNPKKYPEYFDFNELFDAEKFVRLIGFDKLKGLNHIAIKDSGIRLDFAKPTDSWMCSDISQL